MIAAVVRFGESGAGPVGSPVRSVMSSSESAAAPSSAPDRRAVGLKHGAGAAGSGDPLSDYVSSAISGAHQPRLWSPAAVWILPSVVAQQAMMPSATPQRLTRLDNADRTATCQRVLMALSP